MRNHAEHNLQCAIIQALRWNKILCFAVPNGGRRDARTGASLKKEGVLAGVSDLIIVLNNEVIFVEVKTTNGDMQATQIEFKENVEKLGHSYQVWRSVEDAEMFIKMVKSKNDSI